LKIVKGTEIDTEFNNIQTAIATKADLASPTFTGTPTLPSGTIATTQSTSDDSTKIATTAYVKDIADVIKSELFPVGSIYTNATSSTNPATLLGFGTWTAFGAGRVMVGFDSGNALFNSAEETGGSADAVLPSHTHTATSTVTDPGHRHGITGTGSGSIPFVAQVAATSDKFTATATTGITVATSNSTEGVSATNANYQPYITVYIWKRTA
jgi:hypothetical protein